MNPQASSYCSPQTLCDSRRFMKIIITIIFTIYISGCSLLNTMYDDQKVFSEARDSEVGEKINDVLQSEHYYSYWKGQPSNISKEYKITSIKDNTSEYEFEYHECKWGLIVNDTTKIVTSWQYLENKNACKYKRFYEGAF